MTNSYIRSFEEEKKFRNVGRKKTSVCDDPDYAKYQEERTNTLKMSSILKSINSPMKKRKIIAHLR